MTSPAPTLQLTVRWAERFDAEDRARGETLHRSGMTRPHAPRQNLVGGTSWFVNVHDGRWWDCHVDLDDGGEIAAGCTCMVHGHTPCAHLWAAIVAIDERAWERRRGEHPLWRKGGR